MAESRPTATLSGSLVGPVPMEILDQALDQLGWGRKGTTELELRDGWVHSDLSRSAMRGLAMALCRAGGRTVHLVEWTSEANIDDEGDAILERTLKAIDFEPTGAENARAPVVRSESFGDERGTRQSDLLKLAEEEGFDRDEIGPLYARRLPKEPRFGPKKLKVDIPAGWRPPAPGPGLTIHTPKGSMSVSPDARASAEKQLRSEDRLHEGRAPELDRWRERAIRRSGLDARPEPGSAHWAAYASTLCELTRRADRTPTGSVPAWVLQRPGRWAVTNEEAAILSRVRAFPREARDLLAAGTAEIEVGLDGVASTPWE